MVKEEREAEKIEKGFDPELFTEIAKRSGSKQAVKDVGYAKFLRYHKQKVQAIHIGDHSFAVWVVNKNGLRLIGMATEETSKRKGYGKKMLYFVFGVAKSNGFDLVTTRTKTGKDFYLHASNAKITGRKDGDYLMELRIR